MSAPQAMQMPAAVPMTAAPGAPPMVDGPAPVQMQMTAAPQQAMPMMAPANMEKIGNEGTIRMKMMPTDYDGKIPEGCTRYYKRWEVNSHIYGTKMGTMLLKEDLKEVDANECCGAPKDAADVTHRLFSGVDEKRDQELYRMHQQGPVTSKDGGSCCVPITFQTDVMSTDPSKPMRIVGYTKVKFEQNFCNALKCMGPYSDVEVMNRETGARFTIKQAPWHGCRSPCAEGDFALPITMSNGQEVGRLVKEKDAVVDCCGSRWDYQFPTLHMQKKVALTDDDQALIIAGTHQTSYMRRFFSFLTSQGCGVVGRGFTLGYATPYSLATAGVHMGNTGRGPVHM